jgi:hypothetical protein
LQFTAQLQTRQWDRDFVSRHFGFYYWSADYAD